MMPYLRIETLKKRTLSDGTYSFSPPPQPHPREGFVLTQAYKVLSIERRKPYWWHDSWVQTIYSEHISYENYKFAFRCKNSGELVQCSYCLATRGLLEDLRKISSRIIGKHFTKVITFANSHLLKSKNLMSKVC